MRNATTGMVCAAVISVLGLGFCGPAPAGEGAPAGRPPAEAAAVPAPAPTPVPAPVPAEAPVAPKAAAGPALEPGEEALVAPAAGKATGSVNVRVGPAIEKPSLGTIKRGEEVRVLGRLGKWYRVQIPERMPLWISAQHVDVPAGSTFPATGTIRADRVRLRAEGNEKATILKELPRGAQVEVLGKTGTWLKVKAPPDVTAWVFGSYVELASVGATLPPAPKPPEPPPEPGKEPAPPVAPVAPEPGKEPAPGKPPAPGGTLVKGPGVEIFAEAEDAYRQGQAQEPPDFLRAYELYRRALGVKGLPELVRNTCVERLREIEPKLTAEQKGQVDEKFRQELAERIRKFEEQAAAEKAKLGGDGRFYTAEGLLTRAPDVPGIPGTHKLTASGVLLYYLKAGPGVDLDKLVEKPVGVYGSRRLVPGWGTEVIEVLRADELSPPPAEK